MKAIERLRELKDENDANLGIEHFVSLTNPKNVILMESVVSWTCCKVSFDENAEVPEDSTMEVLWSLSSVDIKEFSETVGLTIPESIAKIKQMRKLGLVYPDGTVNARANAVIKLYVKGKMEALS